MHASSKWTRRAILWGGAGAVTTAMIIVGSAAQAAHSTPGAGAARSQPAASTSGPGYPRPGGIYRPFSNCPLANPLMKEAVSDGAVGCIAADVVSGTIKIGNVTTKIKASVNVKYPVTVQFGFWSPPNASPDEYSGGVLPPPDGGLSAQLVSTRQFVRGGLLKALGCPNSNAAVQSLCTEAQQKGGNYLKVYAVAESAGPVTNFDLITWTQPVMFHLINPLLGNSCYIGSADNPVVLNPEIVSGSGHSKTDPHPKQHPGVVVLDVYHASATDTTFTAPGVTGCGPGGGANIRVDEAIDTAVGLPTASGADSIALDGSFYVAADQAPHNKAGILLSAFRASARSGGAAAVPSHQITGNLLRAIEALLKH